MLTDYNRQSINVLNKSYDFNMFANNKCLLGTIYTDTLHCTVKSELIITITNM